MAVDPLAGTMAAFYTFFAGLAILMMAFYVLIILAFVLTAVGIVWGLYSVWTARNKDEWKILWTILLLVGGLIGVALYYFVGKKERIAPK